jgi:plastocyanin
VGVRVLVSVLVVGLAAVAVSATAQARVPHTTVIGLRDASFSLPRVTIRAGDRIRFVWQSGFHDVTRARGKRFAPITGRGAPAVVTRAFPTRGVYVLVCSIHAALGMRITVIVRS